MPVARASKPETGGVPSRRPLDEERLNRATDGTIMVVGKVPLGGIVMLRFLAVFSAMLLAQVESFQLI